MKSTLLVVLELAFILLPGRVLHAQKDNASGSGLSHPNHTQQADHVSTKAPLECMCRPCTGIEDANVIPQELTAFADEGTLTGYFQKSHYKSIE
ncbi:Bursicon [Anopheles sinensis]|uniref:Bursicon n=1 Tax=Anopheles sinensis TaxID=74873 RepID=A0A084W2D4_ANOSI|nr:Bursicon [Anopheles sinensis]